MPKEKEAGERDQTEILFKLLPHKMRKYSYPLLMQMLAIIVESSAIGLFLAFLNYAR
jgi:hypothetical protein